MSEGRSRLSKLLSRAGTASVWAFLLVAAAAAANFIGIRLAGNAEAWDLRMKQHSFWFFAWRLLLYAGTIAGWVWMRRRLAAREPDRATHLRLVRVEIAAVVACEGPPCEPRPAYDRWPQGVS